MARHTKDDTDRLHDYGIYTPSRLIYVGSAQSDSDLNEAGTDYLMAEKLIKNLTILEHISQEPITIVMNNLGGSWYDGLAIYDRIKNSPCHVTIKVYGQAMSMGALILQAADSRVVSANSKIMIHYGQNSIGEVHTKVFETWAEESKKENLKMEQILLDKINQKDKDFTLKKLKKMLDFDTILSAQESVDLGLADVIEGESNK
jgi:ATP-dependent Clp protease protease subunit